MRRQLVYDLPTRIFHGLFVVLFLTAFVIVKTIDDDSPIFSYHSLAGLTLGFLVLLRILWGFFGTKHARFSDFTLKPADLVKYVKGVISGEKQIWAGHNPASSWAALTMMAMAIGLGVTGYLMTSGGDKETFEDIHEFLAHGLIIIAVLHVAGIVLHTIRHQEMIGLSMVDGCKADVPADQTIASSRAFFGVMLVGLVVAFGLHLYKNYDSQTRDLQFFGTTLQLGENEEGQSATGETEGDTEGEDEDDD